jgi:curved DNA-binding protein CbpA
MGTEALELALALHQAPIQRFALRDRPLPKNIGVVLQLASGMQPQLQEAAEKVSESQETVLEAVRFFLHQVLFEPGTDAYRILGLPADADAGLIRQHHAWLQRWLHPDRRGEDWEAVFTTKVNWAWQQLRNEAAREEYDRGRLSAPPPVSEETVSGGAMPMPAWNTAEPPARRAHWLRRIAFGALLVLCGGLFYLAATRDDSIDRGVHLLSAADSDSDMAEEAASAPAMQSAVRQPAPETDGMDAKADAPRALSAGDPSLPIAVETTPEASFPARQARATEAMAKTPTSPQFAADSTLRTTPADEVAAAGGGVEPAAPQRRPDMQDSRTRAPAAVAMTDPVPARPSADSAPAPAPPMPADAAMGTSSASAHSALPSVSEPVDDVSDLDTLMRFERARERLRIVVASLRSPDIELPDWNDADGRRNVARERSALHVRNTDAGIDRFVLDPPTWRVSDANVALEATYHANAGRDVAESGRFVLDMRWQDGDWKITRVKVMPSP